MAGFIDATAGTDNPGSASEVRCGQALAALLPAKHTVVLLPPSGHRGALGGTGATADFIVYSGGSVQSVPGRLEDIQETQNYTITIDAYTPEGYNAAGSVKAVRDKLSTQATAVIVDLVNLGNDKNRNDVITKIITMVDKDFKGRMVVFHYQNASRVYNPVASFADTGDNFL